MLRPGFITVAAVLAGWLSSTAWSQTTGGTAAGAVGGQATAGTQATTGAQPTGQAGAVKPGALNDNPRGSVNDQTTMQFGGISQTPFFSDSAVRQQLKLTDEQFNQLNQAYRNSWTPFQQGIGQLGSNLTEEQRLQRMSALEGTFHQNFSTAINNVFTTPEDRQRFNQIYLQYRGLGAFNDPTLQQRLNLTPDQRRQLAELNREWNSQMGNMNRTYRTDVPGVTNRFNQFRIATRQRLNSLLNEQQRQIWNNLAGDPFDFPVGVYFQNNIAAQGSAGAEIPVTTPAPTKSPRPRQP